MRWFMIGLAAAVLLLAACEAEGPEVGQPTPEPATTPAVTPTGESPSPSPTEAELPDNWTLCTDDEQGYAIGYPQDWHADAQGLRDECSLFDPQPFEVERGTEAPLVAMTVEDPDVSFSRAANRLADEDTERLLMQEETTIDGHDAIRFETEQTEDVLYPAGTRQYGYLIDEGGSAFFVRTTNVPGAGMDYQRNKEVVDQAARTVDFDV